jgi:release factor glutamine methyltransferase
MKSVLEVITSTTDYFAKNKVESPRLNIEHLLAHVLGKKRMDLYMEFDRQLGEQELAPLREFVKRRAAGEPLQYLLGTAEFLGHTLRCDMRALIPRPETEELCEHLFAEAKGEACIWKRGRIIDVGTGSGCIALAFAGAFPEAQITAVDASSQSLALAQENAVKLGFAERVRFVQSDLLEAVDGPFDLLVANLPYIPSAEIQTLQREVLREPLSALDGGPDGLVLVRKLLAQTANKLSPGARIALELHLGQPAALSAEITGQNFRDTRIVKDYSNRERFLFTTHG